ncbi:MAG: hypothetical protein HC882_00895 [Acidobacteria bacterium]|nr:hypothetical protein [Acidobacteriota bacterium]
MKLPTPIIKVVEAARKAVRMRMELKRSVADEASERILAKRRHDVHVALDGLEKAVEAFEKDLAEAKSRRTVKTDWAGVFAAGGALLDLFAKAKKGDRSVIGDARTWVSKYGPSDIIDGEIIE